MDEARDFLIYAFWLHSKRSVVCNMQMQAKRTGCDSGDKSGRRPGADMSRFAYHPGMRLGTHSEQVPRYPVSKT